MVRYPHIIPAFVSMKCSDLMNSGESLAGKPIYSLMGDLLKLIQ